MNKMFRYATGHIVLFQKRRRFNVMFSEIPGNYMAKVLYNLDLFSVAVILHSFNFLV